MIIRLNGELFAGRPAIVNSPRTALDREQVVLYFGFEGDAERVEIALDWADCEKIVAAVFAGGPRLAAYMIWHHAEKWQYPANIGEYLSGMEADDQSVADPIPPDATIH